MISQLCTSRRNLFGSDDVITNANKNSPAMRGSVLPKYIVLPASSSSVWGERGIGLEVCSGGPMEGEKLWSGADPVFLELLNLRLW